MRLEYRLQSGFFVHEVRGISPTVREGSSVNT
jgi:nitrogen regulatory protein PII-like uncharacterized protein